MTYDELIINPDYEKTDEISYPNIKEFIKREIPENHGWAAVAKMYQFFGIFLFGFGLIKAIKSFLNQHETNALIGFGAGIIFSFTVLIVLHELIHAAAYRMVGAKKLSFGANVRKFIFYVQADKQILGYKQFKIVALAPFTIVFLASAAGALLFYGQAIYFFSIAILAIHSFFCMGDFGLLCFFENRKKEEILTVDVKEEGKTYFYKKKKQNDTTI